MHFFVWSKKWQETHQHCMLDRYAFLLAQKSLAKNGFAIWSLRGVKLPFGVLFLGSIEIRNMQTVSDDYLMCNLLTA